ncbi:hypothetical protein GCM10010149_89040 [Nonomuraea roseoviolacea subsp. roseoviolacea]|uniref:DEAD/DEAH box helicase n=1 Tax=Nonomuraea roseoviolacea TaxID=103837 RepID=UPI0031CFB8A6
MLTIDLHSYQDEAVDAFLDRGNMLLAFDMGLGKTVTSLAIAEELLGDEEIDTALIVVPSGLKLQWAMALAKRTDVPTQTITVKGESFQVPEDRYCVVVDGTPKRRREQYQMIKELRPQYVIVGYQTVVSDLRSIKRLKPGLIVLDEATVIKNPAAEVTKCVRQLWAPWRLALTGTPVDNRLEELFHIMAWVDPDLLGDFEKFDRSFIKRDYWGRVKGYVNMPILHRKVAPALIRKRTTDADVAPYMPELVHSRWAVDMDSDTARVYRRIMGDLADELGKMPLHGTFDLAAHYSGEGENTPAGRVMAIHLAGQMLLTCPELLFDSDSAYARDLVDAGVIDGLQLSGKSVRLTHEVDRILADPESKIILVTRFRGMVSRLARQWPQSVVYHGDLNPAEKQRAVNRFETDPKIRVFIMSHAGAYGVDIPAANFLINIDPARATGQRSQINHRHVRAGSKHRRVYVFDLVTSGTIEERDYDRLDVRGRVASAAVDGQGADVAGRVMDDVESLTAHATSVRADS